MPKEYQYQMQPTNAPVLDASPVTLQLIRKKSHDHQSLGAQVPWHFDFLFSLTPDAAFGPPHERHWSRRYLVYAFPPHITRVFPLQIKLKFRDGMETMDLVQRL